MKLPFVRNRATVGAVPVSVNLQRWSLVTLGIAQLFQIGFIGTSFIYANRSGHGNYPWGFFAIELFPVLIFVLAYALSPAYQFRLNRLFIAALKSTIVFSIITLFEMAKNMFGALLLRSHSDQPGHYGQPPMWVTSQVGEYIIIGICLVGFVFITLRQKRKLKK